MYKLHNFWPQKMRKNYVYSCHRQYYVQNLSVTKVNSLLSSVTHNLIQKSITFSSLFSYFPLLFLHDSFFLNFFSIFTKITKKKKIIHVNLLVMLLFPDFLNFPRIGNSRESGLISGNSRESTKSYSFLCF